MGEGRGAKLTMLLEAIVPLHVWMGGGEGWGYPICGGHTQSRPASAGMAASHTHGGLTHAVTSRILVTTQQDPALTSSS